MIVKIYTIDGTLLAEKKLDSFPITIGRAPDCGLVVEVAAVSSRHLEVDLDGNQLKIKDLSSRNGTYINEEQISSRRTSLPCRVRLGHDAVLDFLASEAHEENDLAHIPLDAPSLMMESIPMMKPVSIPVPAVAPQVISAQMAPAIFSAAPSANEKPLAVTPAPHWGRATPATYSYQAPPLLAQAVGYERYWQWLKDLPAQKFLFVQIGLIVTCFLLHWLVFQVNPLVSLLYGFGMAVGSSIVAAMSAAFVALLGLLFRGKYDFRPLFYMHAISFFVTAIYSNALTPGFLIPFLGYLLQLLAFVLVSATGLASIYMFFFNSFSHRFGRTLVIMTFVFWGISFLTIAKDTLIPNRDQITRSAVLGEYGASVKSLGGTQVSAAQATQALREFGRKTASE